jgi:hypothetical protein
MLDRVVDGTAAIQAFSGPFVVASAWCSSLPIPTTPLKERLAFTWKSISLQD